VRSEAARAPARVLAGCAPGIVEVRERGVRFRVEPAGGYSTGFFPDQRGNRAWVSELGARRTLNLFAYTCSFSVCAALAGGVTTSVDVSRRALARGREDFELNGIDAAAGHRFVAEDAATYVARLGRRGESFDLIVLDPPTFGRAGARTFRLAHDLGAVVDGCLGVLARGGRMLVSCNAQGWTEARLRSVVEDALKKAPAWEPAAVPLPHGAVSCRLRRR
jgi:23S rRNA (cytosine1962-C5)-methyltransferase